MTPSSASERRPSAPSPAMPQHPAGCACATCRAQIAMLRQEWLTKAARANADLVRRVDAIRARRA